MSKDADNESGVAREWRSEGVRKTGLLANWRIVAFTFYIGMALFEYGYDKGAIAGFQAMPGFLMVFGYKTAEGKLDIEAEPQQIITSFMTLGSIIGALATGPIGAHLSRRYSLMASSALLIAAVAIMAETTSFGALYFARLLCGLANGILMNFAFVYLQECTPPYLRGLCFGVAAFWITFGTTIGMVVNNETKHIPSRKAYQIPLYVCYPVPALLILTMLLLPESPRWLLHHHRAEEALKSLRFFRKGAYDEVAVLEEFEEMKLVAAREAESQKDWRLVFELFRGTNLRRTVISMAVVSANAAVGAMFILSFGTYFLGIAEVSQPFMWTAITNCFGLLGLIVSWFLISRVGRRRLILASLIICTATMLVIGALYSTDSLTPQQAGIGVIVGMAAYLFGFNLGLEAYGFLTAGELPAQNLRAYTMGLSVAVSFIFAWLGAFTTPYFINPAELNLGPKYCYVWFASGLITTVFIWFMMPDVNGRSLEEIDEMFRNKVPTRQFKTYVCVEVEEARTRGAMHALGGAKDVDGEEKPVEKRVENAY